MNLQRAVKIVGILAAAFVAAQPGAVRADSPVSSPSGWTRDTPRPDAALTNPLVRRGKAVFDDHCRTCHAPAPSAAARGYFPGTYALEMRYQGKLPAALEERTDLTAARVAAVVRQGGGGFMPPLRPTELSDDELKAVAAYLSRRNPSH